MYFLKIGLDTKMKVKMKAREFAVSHLINQHDAVNAHCNYHNGTVIDDDNKLQS